MTKNKKCEKCNKEYMKTFYIRDYYKGISFMNEKPYSKEMIKQKWKSIGLICINCFNMKITNDFLKFYFEKKENIKR